jgi:hypothetical protein
VDYVSCSPFRIPIAKLAAAQIAIESRPQPMSTETPCGSGA